MSLRLCWLRATIRNTSPYWISPTSASHLLFSRTMASSLSAPSNNSTYGLPSNGNPQTVSVDPRMTIHNTSGPGVSALRLAVARPTPMLPTNLRAHVTPSSPRITSGPLLSTDQRRALAPPQRVMWTSERQITPRRPINRASLSAYAASRTQPLRPAESPFLRYPRTTSTSSWKPPTIHPSRRRPQGKETPSCWSSTGLATCVIPSTSP
ncbi:hypothetical protein EDB83DRAFT_2374425 [Lactarius deliciosus]|nr:hypothetical protein EDB83DRAFT_2374425 [Lactarius deliciosus]